MFTKSCGRSPEFAPGASPSTRRLSDGAGGLKARNGYGRSCTGRRVSQGWRSELSAANEKNWSFSEYAFTYEFSVHRSFLVLLESLLTESLDEFQMDMTATASLEEDEALRESLFDFLRDQEERGEQYKGILFNSFFSASFALFESKMMLICSQVKRDVGSQFSVGDMRGGSHLGRAKMYLEKLGVDFPAQGSDWKEINTFQKIRNKIMHEGGSVSKSLELMKYAEERQILSSWSGGELELNRQFCEEAIDNLEQFLVSVQRRCDSWREGKIA